MLVDPGKLSEVEEEMNKYGIQVLGLCETRWSGFGKTTQLRNTFIYSGRGDEDDECR